jgi:hypothetical protein
LHRVAFPVVSEWCQDERQPESPLRAYELAERVCRVFDCPDHEHLIVPQEIA